MRYLLVVGFACNVYQREPLARIFVGDRLVDEFVIQHHIDTFTAREEFFFKNKHSLQPFPQHEISNMCIETFPPLQMYELEMYDDLYQVKLRIEIENEDSNYSNGFMTASTLIQLQVCHFFPMDQTLIGRLRAIMTKNRFTENYAWYRSTKSSIFDLARAGICWHGKNGEKIYNNTQGYNIGGSGNFVCGLEKKYGIFIPKLACPHRYNLPNVEIMNFLHNKYTQYAHQ